jgi:hypothetical protein
MAIAGEGPSKGSEQGFPQGTLDQKGAFIFSATFGISFRIRDQVDFFTLRNRPAPTLERLR